jgi:hypothetical protein
MDGRHISCQIIVCTKCLICYVANYQKKKMFQKQNGVLNPTPSPTVSPFAWKLQLVSKISRLVYLVPKCSTWHDTTVFHIKIFQNTRNVTWNTTSFIITFAFRFRSVNRILLTASCTVCLYLEKAIFFQLPYHSTGRNDNHSKLARG